MSNKRRRHFGGRRAARPIDKQIITIDRIGGIDEADTLMIVQAGARTLTGLRWMISFSANTSQSSPSYFWAIVLVKDGDVANALDIQNLGSLYQPEQHALVWGAGRLTPIGDSSGPRIMKDQGTTKIMRKMMDGDKLVLLSTTNVNAGILVTGAVQFFMLF